MKLRGGSNTRKIRKKNSKGKIALNVDELYNSLVTENMKTPVVRANSTRRKRANTVKQSNPVTCQASEGAMHSYNIRHNRATDSINNNRLLNKGKIRSRSKSRGRVRSKSRGRVRSKSRGRSRSKSRGRSRSKSRGRSRSKSRGRVRDKRFDPYDSSSEFEKLLKDLSDKPLRRNSNSSTTVRQSKGEDRRGTFGRPYG